MKIFGHLLILISIAYVSCSAQKKHGYTSNYRWEKISDSVAFPRSYNFQLFNCNNTLWVFHSGGVYSSSDGKIWVKSALRNILNNAFLDYIPFNNCVYALGTFEGNIERYAQTSRISKTTDFKTWVTVAETSNLPKRYFYPTIVLHNKVWLCGGQDNNSYFNDVWNSSDCIHWTKVSDNCPWSKRGGASLVIFNDKLYLIGGGTHGESNTDVWSSNDGVHWDLETPAMSSIPFWGYSAIVYDGIIWLLGCNRNGEFTREIMSSQDGRNWTPSNADWSPRGGIASVVFQDKLFMSGGKYSTGAGANIRFIYNNDVWEMEKK